MLIFMKSINVEAQTITFELQEGAPPEHDRDGRMCHAMEGAMASDECVSMLRYLGFELVSAEVVKHHMAFPPASIVQYWARQEG